MRPPAELAGEIDLFVIRELKSAVLCYPLLTRKQWTRNSCWLSTIDPPKPECVVVNVQQVLTVLRPNRHRNATQLSNSFRSVRRRIPQVQLVSVVPRGV